MRGHVLRWLGALAAILLAAGVFTGTRTAAYAESNGGVRVMPLGDSITDGVTVPGGYRIGLWQRFVNDGYKVDFVGSLSNGPSTLGDHDHEGHSGWRIDQIDANITGWLRTYTPHTVLLHIGTNDVIQNHDLANAPARLSALIDHITASVPSAEVLVATIIPLANSGQEASVRTFNAAIPGIVQSKAAAGQHVHLVDMHAALTAADLADGVHPNAAGYDKMAATWYSALRSIPGSIGDRRAAGAPPPGRSTPSGRASAWTSRTPPGPTAPSCRSTTATEAPARPGPPRAAGSSSTTAPSAWTPTATRPRRAPRSRSGTATAEPTSSGRSPPAAPSPASSPACAWTWPTPRPPTARRSSSGPATAARTRNGA